MSVTNKDVAAIFGEMADLTELQDGNAFRIRSFRRVAQVLEDLHESVASLYASGALGDIPGVGKGTVRRVGQILETGSCDDHRELREKMPAGLLDMLQISGMGPKTVKLVYERLEVSSVDELEAACKAGHLAELPRMGEKTQDRILKSIESWRKRSGRMPLGEAIPAGKRFLDALGALECVTRCDLAGSSRRRRETIGDLDVLVASREVAPVMDAFAAQPLVAEVLLRGDTKCSVRLESGLQVDLRVLEPESYGAALHYFTGSQMHNIAIRDRGKRAGLRINEYGVYREPTEEGQEPELIGGASEEEVFAAVNLPYIAPELRENRGEIEAAEKGTLPELLTDADLRGDLHVHTDAAEGKDSLEAMVDAARALGRRYIAITDRLASADALAEQRRAIEALQHKHDDIRLLAGVEVVIDADGQLSLDAQTLKQAEWVIACAHDGYDGSGEAMLARLERAMRSGVVDCIGHPANRILGERPGAPIDHDKLIALAAETGVFIELNSDPRRLDLDAAHCRQARAHDVMVALCSDARSADELSRSEFGVYTARRGWLEVDNVLTAQPIEVLLERRAARLS